MSASYGWKPVKPTEFLAFKNHCNSDHTEKIKKIFGRDMVLTDANLVKLRDFAEITEDNLWNELADLIIEFGAIQLRIEY